MKSVISAAVFLAAWMAVVPAYGDVAVIVNPANNNDLSAKDISRLFLGKKKSFPDGSSAKPFYVQSSQSSRQEFDSKVLKKSESQLKAYWSKLMFTGKGTMPQELASDADVKGKVASDASAIGYIDAAQVDDSVKVLSTF